MPRLMQSLFISAALITSPLLLLSTAVQAANTTASTAAATFSQQEIEQLVAPIALYPDALLAQVLMASTYPLEVVQAARWRKDNPKLKDKALEDALQKQTWDPAVKSLTVFPDVLQMMNDKIDWTQKLGDAFLAQQKDVMEASQRLRAKADAEGNLKTSKEQKVSTEAASSGSTTIYKIEPQTETIYVPVYNPTVVYGTWPYPYYTPYYWYPPAYPYGGAAFGFTTGIIFGAALWGNSNWGGNDVNIDIDRYNNFNRVEHYDRGNGNKWNHNPEHRRGVEYRDNKTRDQYRPSAGTRDQQRDDFRGKADASRGDLKNVDRSSVQNQLKDADRSEISNRAKDQSGQRDRANTSDRAADRSGQADHGSRDMNRPSKPTYDNNRSAASRDNAFSGADRGQVNRAASTRGASSQRSMSRPTRSGGGRR
ncbi:DUF3300 domain-containing protein [Deefgea rivuli]|uniref:DUF3300 domain-containing protein n=1 Tax=Deefgea rivuli TaxID=400948 RepID=UPI0006883110|nr:DUF3300 domain-containing protein [Deefgea rivuli]